jgi:hypothetical protein
MYGKAQKKSDFGSDVGCPDTKFWQLDASAMI